MGKAVIHILIEHIDLNQAISTAREIYVSQAAHGRHVVLDAPGDLRTNLNERRLSAADVLITARRVQSPTTNCQS